MKRTTLDNIHERFFCKVDFNGPVSAQPDLGPCHVWVARRDLNGYGLFQINRRKLFAHRVAFFLAHGRWPEPCALHRCDNPACVNSAHLFEGTNADNIADKVAKRRAPSGIKHWSHTKPERRPRGARNGCAKLTEKDVRYIRRDYARGGVTQAELARQRGVSRRAVGFIVRGQTWVHIKGSP